MVRNCQPLCDIFHVIYCLPRCVILLAICFMSTSLWRLTGMIETMPTYALYIQTFSIIKDLLKALFCKRPVGEGSLLTHLLRHTILVGDRIYWLTSHKTNRFRYLFESLVSKGSDTRYTKRPPTSQLPFGENWISLTGQPEVLHQLEKTSPSWSESH